MDACAGNVTDVCKIGQELLMSVRNFSQCHGLPLGPRHQDKTSRFLLQSQNKHLSSVSNAGKASILGILALPRSLCVINAAERTLYGSQCLSKTVAELQPNESNLDSAFLDTLTHNSPETWRVKLKLVNQTLEFKIDAGAEVTAISDVAFRAFKGLKLDRPKKMLYGPARTLLKVIGQFEGKIFYRGKTTKQNVYVVNGLRTNLQGLPAILEQDLEFKSHQKTNFDKHHRVHPLPDIPNQTEVWICHA